MINIKRINEAEPFPMLTATLIVLVLALAFIYKPEVGKNNPTTVYTYSDIYYLTPDSLTSETGNVSYHGTPQAMKDSLEVLTARDVNRFGAHYCADSTHYECDTLCSCDGFNCEQSEYETGKCNQ